MRKLLTSLILCAGLAGCATTGDQTQPTPAQLVAKFCPIVQTLNLELTTVPGVNPDVVDAIKQAQPIVNAVCATGATINTANLQDLLDNGLPLLLKIATDSAISATPAGRTLLIAIPIAQVMIPQILNAK